jgi:DNA-binding winged helix-turn-helix (wHTH) protein
MSASESNGVYEFGGFVVDPTRRLLTRAGGEPIAITAKALDALVYLLEHAGEVVPRSALMQALWPTAAVSDARLRKTISDLRRAIGDARDGRRYLVTVPRRGYQLVAEVRPGPRPDAARANGRGPDHEPQPAPVASASASGHAMSEPAAAAADSGELQSTPVAIESDPSPETDQRPGAVARAGELPAPPAAESVDSLVARGLARAARSRAGAQRKRRARVALVLAVVIAAAAAALAVRWAG